MVVHLPALLGVNPALLLERDSRGVRRQCSAEHRPLQGKMHLKLPGQRESVAQEQRKST